MNKICCTIHVITINFDNNSFPLELTAKHNKYFIDHYI